MQNIVLKIAEVNNEMEEKFCFFMILLDVLGNLVFKKIEFSNDQKQESKICFIGILYIYR